MSPRVGIELTAHTLRGVILTGWRRAPARTAEVPWNPAAPEEGVRALRAALGTGDAIALAVGLAYLHVKRLELPPGSDAVREAMVALEAERFFALPSPSIRLVTGIAPGGEVAFGLDEEQLARWLRAFEAWAPVERCEPAPVAIVRALGASVSGDFRVDAGDGEAGLVGLRAGVVHVARRTTADALPTTLAPLRGVAGHDSRWTAAIGAALGEDADDVGTLASPERRSALRARRARRMASAVAAVIASLVFCAAAFDRSRERTLAALENEAVRLAAQARPALDAQARLASLDRESRTIREVAARRVSPVAALAAIGDVLPPDAVVLSARAAGDQWQIDGTASSASALVPLLDRDARFDDVRSLAASSRFRDGARDRETFSITFRVSR